MVPQAPSFVVCVAPLPLHLNPKGAQRRAGGVERLQKGGGKRNKGAQSASLQVSLRNNCDLIVLDGRFLGAKEHIHKVLHCICGQKLPTSSSGSMFIPYTSLCQHAYLRSSAHTPMPVSHYKGFNARQC